MTPQDGSTEPEAYRDAQSTRAYARFQRMGDHSVTITPYWRDNRMEFLQHYLPWKSRERNAHSSLGLQASAEGSASMSYLLGIDVDSTEGTYLRIKQRGLVQTSPLASITITRSMHSIARFLVSYCKR